MTTEPEADSTSTYGSRLEKVPLAFVAPRHPQDADWPWITDVGPMRSLHFRKIFIDNTCHSVPKLTGPFIHWQYLQAMLAIRSSELAFLFSTDIGIGMTGPLSRMISQPKRIYVGFTQDGPWPEQRIARLARALGSCHAVTVFTEDERQVYLKRFDLEPERVRVIPLHTDETDGYREYGDESPRTSPYVLSLGSPNRRFKPVAAACKELGIDLIIITRPWHKNDSLEELADLGAEIITDADKQRALTYLKHARLAVAVLDDPTIPGGFTTLVHSMYLRTPFVLSRALGVAEHVIDGETGFVTPHDDEPALREAIHKLWSDPQLAHRFGEKAFDLAHKRHSLEAAAGMFHDLALKVLEQQPRRMAA